MALHIVRYAHMSMTPSATKRACTSVSRSSARPRPCRFSSAARLPPPRGPAKTHRESSFLPLPCRGTRGPPSAREACTTFLTVLSDVPTMPAICELGTPASLCRMMVRAPCALTTSPLGGSMAGAARREPASAPRTRKMELQKGLGGSEVAAEIITANGVLAAPSWRLYYILQACQSVLHWRQRNPLGAHTSKWVPPPSTTS